MADCTAIFHDGINVLVVLTFSLQWQYFTIFWFPDVPVGMIAPNKRWHFEALDIRHPSGWLTSHLAQALTHVEVKGCGLMSVLWR